MPLSDHAPKPLSSSPDWDGEESIATPKPHLLPLQTDVFIAMELMGTCAEKLKKRMQGPIPERILGKMTVAVSGQAGAGAGGPGPIFPAPGHSALPFSQRS